MAYIGSRTFLRQDFASGANGTPEGGIWMLTKSTQIILDNRIPSLKTVICAPMVGNWLSSVYNCLPESDAPEHFRLRSPIAASGDLDRQIRVSVDNRNACRLDYLVAKKIKDFYVGRIHSGCRFLSNARARNLLVFASGARSDWHLCSLNHSVQQPRHQATVVLLAVEMNQ